MIDDYGFLYQEMDASMTIPDIKITILVDNESEKGLVQEHGFSLWIEAYGRKILFDTGQGKAIEKNSDRLGIDLEKTDILIISHGHYDHTGGIARVIKQARSTRVYCHPGIVYPRYSIFNGIAKPIQIPCESMEAIEKLPQEHLHWVQEPVWLSDEIGMTGPIPRSTSYENTGGPFYLDPDGKRSDPIEDDLALWIRAKDGIIICVGCSHAGLVNTLNFVQSINHGMRFQAIIGGFHLINAGYDRLEKTMAALRLFQPDMIVPCHCTGEAAVAVLRNGLGRIVLPGAAGMSYRFQSRITEDNERKQDNELG